MLTATFRRATILLLLTAFLAAPLAAAAPRDAGPKPGRTVVLASWDLLDGVWSFLKGLWSKTGCDINPNGLCDSATALPTPQPKAGCDVDPDGHCHQ